MRVCMPSSAATTNRLKAFDSSNGFCLKRGDVAAAQVGAACLTSSFPRPAPTPSVPIVERFAPGGQCARRSRYYPPRTGHEGPELTLWKVCARVSGQVCPSCSVAGHSAPASLSADLASEQQTRDEGGDPLQAGCRAVGKERREDGLSRTRRIRCVSAPEREPRPRRVDTLADGRIRQRFRSRSCASRRYKLKRVRQCYVTPDRRRNIEAQRGCIPAFGLCQ